MAQHGPVFFSDHVTHWVDCQCHVNSLFHHWVMKRRLMNIPMLAHTHTVWHREGSREQIHTDSPGEVQRSVSVLWESGSFHRGFAIWGPRLQIVGANPFHAWREMIWDIHTGPHRRWLVTGGSCSNVRVMRSRDLLDSPWQRDGQRNGQRT